MRQRSNQIGKLGAPHKEEEEVVVVVVVVVVIVRTAATATAVIVVVVVATMVEVVAVVVIDTSTKNMSSTDSINHLVTGTMDAIIVWAWVLWPLARSQSHGNPAPKPSPPLCSALRLWRSFQVSLLRKASPLPAVGVRGIGGGKS